MVWGGGGCKQPLTICHYKPCSSKSAVHYWEGHVTPLHSLGCQACYSFLVANYGIMNMPFWSSGTASKLNKAAIIFIFTHDTKKIL